MNTVEEAYEQIAHCLLPSDGKKWDEIVLETKILKNNFSDLRLTLFNQGFSESLGLSMRAASVINIALIFLRDDLMKAKGDRIWGLTYTLFPTGKMRIEYDYNKPADYEESDATITDEEATQTLIKLGLLPK